MFKRLFLPAAVFSVSAYAADLSSIPFAKADGKTAKLADYSGKVVLVVNVASKCGLTAQYKQLEELYREFKDDGLVVLGFPCNDFGNQEPGTIEEIQTFCKDRYDVTFPIMGKLSVKGKSQHALYEALTGKSGAFPGDVKWNFGKFLIGKDGKPLARFEPTTKPDSAEVKAAIRSALAK